MRTLCGEPAKFSVLSSALRFPFQKIVTFGRYDPVELSALKFLKLSLLLGFAHLKKVKFFQMFLFSVRISFRALSVFHLVWCDAECTVDTSASCLHEFSVQFLTDDSVKLGCFILTVDEQQPSWNSLKDAAVDNGQTVFTALVNICSALIIVWRHQPAKLHNS